MAVGDDALAAGMTLVLGTQPANTLETIINGVLDEIARRTSAVMPITRGGTGSTNADGARTALGLPALGSADLAQPNRLPVYNGTSQLTTADPTLSGHAASKGYIDAINVGIIRQGNDCTLGQIFLPSSYAAVSGYTIAYIDGTGRISRGASALKYKKCVSKVDPCTLGDIFPQLVRYQMRSLDGTGDGDWKLGHIADWLADNPSLERFVVRLGGEIESIDFIQLLLAQTAQLHAREVETAAELDLAAQRIDALTRRLDALTAPEDAS